MSGADTSTLHLGGTEAIDIAIGFADVTSAVMSKISWQHLVPRHRLPLAVYRYVPSVFPQLGLGRVAILAAATAYRRVIGLLPV